jgi:hypothetical protein
MCRRVLAATPCGVYISDGASMQAVQSTSKAEQGCVRSSVAGHQ